MRIAIYGGSFNPPHIGHVRAAEAACRQICPDKLLIIPACIPPHKEMDALAASASQRLHMADLSFHGISHAEISDMEIRRGGKSYTSDTIRELMSDYSGAELFLLMGTDMLISFERWFEFEFLLKNTTLAVFVRDNGERKQLENAAEHLREKYGARIEYIETEPLRASSTEIRQLLRRREGRELLMPETYSYIISLRLYGAKPEFEWLRDQAYAMLNPKRIAHVIGCEQEAVKLADRWDADREEAAEAGILHDITKKLVIEEQLLLCENYGIITDIVERESPKLMHAKTGAAVSRDLFGVSDAVYNAIKWHTTGRANMSLLEKIIYMADYIEPNRDFPGVDELRHLAYEDIDKAMVLGLEMSLDDIASHGVVPHENTTAALEWYRGNA